VCPSCPNAFHRTCVSRSLAADVHIAWVLVWGVWWLLQDYKQFLESMTVGASDEKGAFVKDFKVRTPQHTPHQPLPSSQPPHPFPLHLDQPSCASC
jgi:hypothetical protein